MKTKILFFFLLLVRVGNGFAQSPNTDSLLQEIKQARSFLENWDTIPATDNDKLLAFMTGAPVQVSDSIRNKNERCLGFLIPKTYHYRRYIEYDKTNKVFKEKLELSEKTNDIDRIILLAVIYSLLVFCLAYFTKLQYRDKINIAWGLWALFIGLLIHFSYSLGSLVMISSLTYIFKEEIRIWIKNLLQKNKEKRKQKQKKE